MTYEEYIASKVRHITDAGFDAGDLPGFLFPFQDEIVRHALKRGRYAIFAECGLGKTPMQLVWADEVRKHTGKPVLILAPLAVASQTEREGSKFGIDVKQTQDGTLHPVTVTNYEHIEKYDPCQLGGIVLDESSILKNYAGKLRKLITAFALQVPYRLSATATPAPNDFMEFGTQAEFLGYGTYVEMLSTYFVHDGGDTSKWRLKKHAVADFKEWLSEWSTMIDSPRDMGYNVDGYKLPPMHEHERTIDDHVIQDALFETVAVSLNDQRRQKKKYADMIAEEIADIVSQDDEQYIVWVEQNYEADAICKLVPDAVEIRGSDHAKDKAARMMAFSDGDIRVLVTKPSIAGFGMNWQNCRNVVFSSIGHSYEQRYQAVRRCYRFGQERDVHVFTVRYPGDDAIAVNYDRKEKAATYIKEKA